MSGIPTETIRQRAASAIGTAMTGWRQCRLHPRIALQIGDAVVPKSYCVDIPSTVDIDSRSQRGSDPFRVRHTVVVGWVSRLRPDKQITDLDAGYAYERAILAAVLGMSQTGAPSLKFIDAKREPAIDSSDAAYIVGTMTFTIDAMVSLDGTATDPGGATPTPEVSDWYVPLLTDATTSTPESGDAITQDADGWITGTAARSVGNRLLPYDASGDHNLVRATWPLVDATGVNPGWPYNLATTIVELFLETSATTPASSTGARVWMTLAASSAEPALADTHRAIGWSVADGLLHNVQATTQLAAASRGHVYARAPGWSTQWTGMVLNTSTLKATATSTGTQAYQSTGSPYLQLGFGCTFGSGTTGAFVVRPRVRLKTNVWPTLG